MAKNKDNTPLPKFFNYLLTHKVSFGLSLATYGIFYLSSVIISGWTLNNLGKDVTVYLPFSTTSFLSSNLLNPFFFVTSFPTLILGIIILSAYSLTAIKPEAADNKEHVAILLIIFGFTYQVIGAWPLGVKSVFQWEWQKQIISFGSGFAWTLSLLSLTALVVGSISLFIHSKIYHQKHPEFKVINLEN